jgi:hypothetical protein
MSDSLYGNGLQDGYSVLDLCPCGAVVKKLKENVRLSP